MDQHPPTTTASAAGRVSACEPSRLHVPNDTFYVEPACRFVAEMARQIGFDPPRVEQIADGLRTALSALLRYSFAPHEKGSVEVSCERIPAGLSIALRDRGLPLGLLDPESADPELQNPFFGLNHQFDDVRICNRGREGKEIVLGKHLPDPSLAEFAAACRMEPPEPSLDAHPPLAVAAPCTARALDPAEAHEVSKAVYKAYGYSYPHDVVYYPEKIVAHNRSGQMISAVAESAGGEIAGHCSLQRWEENPQIVELTQGVIAPEFRSQGCFVKLTDYLIATARDRGLSGVFGEAVTAHPYSQRAALQCGLRECALFLGLIPVTADFKGLGGRQAERGSMLVQYRQLKPAPPVPVYAPARHAAMIAAAYANLGLHPDVRPPGLQPDPLPAGDGDITVALIRPLGLARIRIERWGSGSLEALARHVRALSRGPWEVIHLLLGLADPATARWCGRIEELGFFFAGILPCGLPSGDALILQRLNVPPIRYDALQTASAFAAQLVAYVRAQDPDQRT